MGNGRQTRDFIYIDDLTDAFLKIIKSNLKNKIYNLGSGKETSINKIASLIEGKKFLFLRDLVKQSVLVLISLKFVEILIGNQKFQ